MKNSNESRSKPTPPQLSRRDLFRTAGLAAGGVMLIGLPNVFGGLVTEAEAAIADKGGPSTVALELDGQFVGFLRSVSGGNAFADVVTTPTGPQTLPQKHVEGVRYEDLIVELPISGDAKLVGTWINDSLTKNVPPKNGAILYTDFNMNVVKRLDFMDATVTEVAFQNVDAGAAKEPASFLLRITPQSTRLGGGAGKLPAMFGSKSKLLSQGNFRFNIQGLEPACKRIAKVEGLAAKRTVSNSAPGEMRVAQSTVGPWNSSLISIHLQETDGGPFYQWFEESVVKGNPGSERGGLFEWLDPTLKNTMASVQLGGLGIVRYAPAPIKDDAPAGIAGRVTARSPMVQIDLYYETMTVAV